MGMRATGYDNPAGRGAAYNAAHQTPGEYIGGGQYRPMATAAASGGLTKPFALPGVDSTGDKTFNTAADGSYGNQFSQSVPELTQTQLQGLAKAPVWSDATQSWIPQKAYGGPSNAPQMIVGPAG